MKSFNFHFELIKNLVARELKSRYKGSMLGFFWTLLTPLFMALIYLVFLRLLAGRGISLEEIIIGVFAWQFTVMCVQGGMTSITGSANLVKKVYFPRLLLPLSQTLSNLVNYLLSLIIQFILVGILLAMQGGHLAWTSLLVPLVVLHHFILNLGLSFFLSALNVYFRDTQHIVGILLTAWFFLSPAMYSVSFVRDKLPDYTLICDLYMLNPLAPIMTMYRALILPGVTFEWSLYAAIGLLWPLLLGWIGLAYFMKAQRYFADLL